MLTAIFLGSKNFKDDEMFYIKTRPPLLPIANSCHLIKIAFFIHSTIHCYLSSCIQGLWRKMHTKGGAPPPHAPCIQLFSIHSSCMRTATHTSSLIVIILIFGGGGSFFRFSFYFLFHFSQFFVLFFFKIMVFDLVVL